MRALLHAAAAVAVFGSVAAGAGSASALPVQPGLSVSTPAVVDVRAVRVCRTVTVRKHRAYYPFRPYYVKVRSCRWV